MSQSPANHLTPAASSGMNNGTQSSSRRRRQPTNVFMAKKTHQKPSNPQALSAERRAKNVLQSTPIATPPPAAAFTPAAEPEDDPSTYTDYPLVTTKKALLADLRFHAMRLVSRNKLSPYNRRQFERPLRLHRRFERDKKVDLPKQSGTDDKEVDKEAIREAERQATKEANQAQIAPAEKGAVGKRKQNVKRKVEDVYIANTVEAQKRRKLRYDETRPWHLEDLEGKNTWVGAYEAPLSETYAMLVLAEDKFRMVPIEKWYRFAPTGRFEVKDADFIEKWMNKKSHAAMRLLQSRDDADHRRIVTQQRRTQGAGRVGMRGENKPRGDDDDHEGPEAVHDADELDFEDNDFQDDDEGCLLIGEDEEVKDMERKIKNEMLGANIFTDIKEEKDWDAEEARNKVKKEEKRRKERKLRKTLRKREKKYEYESESDSDSARPKSSSEDSAGSDADSDGELKLEDTDVKAESKVDGDKPPSGASSVGSNTPAGQHGRSSSRHHNGASLKRPGSPMLSDVSGSESSRKRVKQTKENAASRPMSPNIGDGSRPLSPSIRLRNSAGSGSETEGASGTERTKRRLVGNKGSSTPLQTANGHSGSRASSPGASAGPMPSLDDIRAAIPHTGISITALIQKFKSRVTERDAKVEFIRLVKQVGQSKPNDKGMIVPRA